MNDTVVSSVTERVNELIESISEDGEGDNKIISIRTKVIKGLEEIEMQKVVNDPLMLGFKTKIDCVETRGFKVPLQSEGELVECDIISDKLSILSKESSKINRMILETI